MNKLKEKLVSVLAVMLLTVSASSASGCTLETIALDSTVIGSWGTDCNATHREGSHARYYTFTLTSDETVRIDLNSSLDTYLYLLQDANTSGSIINSDDDGGEGLNSRMYNALTAGTYTIEATTFGTGVIGDFNLSVNKAAASTYHVKGKVDLPSEVQERLQNCQNEGCPYIDVSASYQTENFNEQIFSSVDYNDTTGQYEYRLDLIAEANSSTTIDMRIVYGWMDETDGEVFRDVYYSFGVDNAVGGTGDNADFPIDEYDCGVREPLIIANMELVTQVDINLSAYVPTVTSSLSMTIDNVPPGYDVYLHAYDKDCNGGLGGYYWKSAYGSAGGHNGMVTLTINGLIDGHEHGLAMEVGNNQAGYYELYRLNDDDGDFTNGGVFVEEFVNFEVFNPVFDKTFFATPEDINISAPENLSFGNPALVPLMYMLLM